MLIEIGPDAKNIKNCEFDTKYRSEIAEMSKLKNWTKFAEFLRLELCKRVQSLYTVNRFRSKNNVK